MKRGIITATAIVLLASLMSACGTNVERIRPDETRDLSGMWNDTDSRLVSEEMITTACHVPGSPISRARTASRRR